MVEIFTGLLEHDFEIDSVELESEDFGYKDEYLMGIIDGDIIIEKMKHNGEYCDVYADIVYVLDNCKSKVIASINKADTYEVRIVKYEDEEADKLCTCDRCFCKKKDEKSTLKVTVNGNEITDEKEKVKYLNDFLDRDRFYDSLFSPNLIDLFFS